MSTRQAIIEGTEEQIHRIQEILGHRVAYVVTSENNSTVGFFQDGPRVLKQVAEYFGMAPEDTRDWDSLEHEDKENLMYLVAGNSFWDIEKKTLAQESMRDWFEDQPEFRAKIVKS